MATDKTVESEAIHVQFKRNLDHILIDAKEVGPELTVGKTVLTFRAKVPVKALARLIGTEDRIGGMEAYIRTSLTAGQDEKLDEIMDNVDIDGLAEIVNALGEAYTSFPEPS